MTPWFGTPIAVHPYAFDFKRIGDGRGVLAVAEINRGLPFYPQRLFMIDNDRSVTVARGAHAHRAQDQLLIAMHGKICVSLDQGSGAEIYRLGEEHEFGRAVFVPSMTWLEMDLMPYARLLVLASATYDEGDYIRDRDEFDRVRLAR